MYATTQPQRFGRYALCDRIASGGMATVYFGRLVGSGGFSRIVALKRLHPHLTEEKGFTSMLLDEAYLAGRIRHPNVVSTLDIVSTDRELVIVMEYVHGETLSRLMQAATRESRPIPRDIAVAIIVGVLNGLHAAHETTNEQGEPLRIVHRDVSPQNVVVGVDGIARLLDFGVAKAQDRLQTTKDGHIKGKIAYMAVEQLTNAGVDRRADIYAAGVILWELLTCKRLCAGETESSTMHSILTGSHPRPSSEAPGVPAALDAITMRALARSPSQRYETARQMSLALEQAAELATTTEVGEWVATVAEPQLAERARVMRAIDASHGPRTNAASTRESSGSIDLVLEPSLTRPEGSTTEVTQTQSSFFQTKWGVYGLVGAIVLALVSVTLVARTSAHKNDAQDVAKALSTPAPSVEPASLPAASSSPPTPPSAAPVVASPSAATQAPLPIVPPRSRNGARATPPSRTVKPDCTTPYTVDEIGVRHYRTECSR